MDEELALMVASTDVVAKPLDPSAWGWDDGADEAAPHDVEMVDHDGGRVTAAEASLLACYARDAAEAAAKRAQREARQAAQAAQRRRADVAPAARQLKNLDDVKDKVLLPLGGGRPAAQAASRAFSVQDTFTKRPEAPAPTADDAPTRSGAPTASVPKRAKTARSSAPAVEPEPQWAQVDVPSATATADVTETPGVKGFLDVPKTAAAPKAAEEGEEEEVAAPPCWDSRIAEDPLELLLPRFGANGGNQTLLLRVSVGAEALIWALNIAPKDHDDCASILYHFNPRRVERNGVLVQNDKFDDDWGRATKSSIGDRRYPPMFGLANAELAFQFQPCRLSSGPGMRIVTAVDRKVIEAWDMRCPPPESGTDLSLVIPTRDDFNNVEAITVHSAWWGQMPNLDVPTKPQHSRR